MQIQAANSTAALYQAPPTTQATEQNTEQPAAKPMTPTVEVSSSASLLMNALADIILGGASSGQGASNALATAQAKPADGDENAQGQETNDGDADDMPAGAMPKFADTGTYNFGGATA